MHQGNGHPIKLLVLGGSDIQAAARWGAVPPEAEPRIVSDVYAAAVEVVRGAWDALLVDPGYLSASAITLIDGSVKQRGMRVWIFDSGTNTGMSKLALNAGAVALAMPGRAPEPRTNGSRNGYASRMEEGVESAEADELRGGEILPEVIGALQTLTPSLPTIMTDEEAIRVALGYADAENGSAENHGRAKRTNGKARAAEPEIVDELNGGPENPVLTDAELRALLGEDDH